MRDPNSRPKDLLISGKQVKEIFHRNDPDYGTDFDDAKWDEIALRLSMLTRLIWRVSCRQAKAVLKPKSQ